MGFFAGFSSDLTKIAKDCFFCAASKAALSKKYTLMRGAPASGSGDTAHFWLRTKSGKVVDPTASQYPGYKYKGKAVSLDKNLDAVIRNPLFKKLPKADQGVIVRRWESRGEA